MALFTNPLQTDAQVQSSTQVQSAIPAPQMGGSTLGTDIAQAATFGLKLFARAQDQQKQQNIAESVSKASDMALSRMQEYNELVDAKGAVRARQWLQNQYLQDARSLGGAAQKTYLTQFKEVFGGSPQDAEVDAESKAIEAQLKNDRELLESGRQIALGYDEDPANYSPQQLMLMAETRRGKNAMVSARIQEQTMLMNESNLQDRESTAATNATMQAFSAEFDSAVSTKLTGFWNVLQSEEYVVQQVDENGEPRQVTLTGQEAVSAARDNTLAYIARNGGANLRSTLRNLVRENGGDPGKLSQADYDAFQSELDYVQEFVTGDLVSKMNKQQLDATMQAFQTDLFKNSPDFVRQMVVAKNTGAPMNIGVSAEQVMGSTARTFNTDPTSGLVRRLQDTHRYGAASAASSPQETADNISTVIKAMDMPMSENQMRDAGSTLTRTLMNGVDADPDVVSRANGKGGVIELHRKFATDAKAAQKFFPEMQREAERRGTSVDEIFSRQIERFSRGTLIPSLGLEGIRREGDVTGLEAIQAEVKNGKIVLNLSQAPSVTRTTPLGRDDYKVGYQQFRTRLKKAESELNTILMSYSNLTGADANDVALSALQAFGAIGEENAK